MPPRISLVFAITFASLIALFFREYLYLEQSFRETRFESAKFAWGGTRMEQKDVHFLTQLDAFNYVAKNRPRPGMSQAELDLYRRVFLRYHFDAFLFRYIEAMLLNNEPEAASYYLQLLRRSRGDDVYYQAVQQLALSAEGRPEVEKVLKSLVDPAM